MEVNEHSPPISTSNLGILIFRLSFDFCANTNITNIKLIKTEKVKRSATPQSKAENLPTFCVPTTHKAGKIHGHHSRL